MQRILTALLIVYLAAGAIAQTWRGNITGQVLTAAGQPVAGARVSLTSPETGMEAEVRSGEDGAFAFASLRPGRYRIEVEQANYRKFVETVTLMVDQNIFLRAPMLAGSVSEEITVTAARELLKTESSSLSTVIDTAMIRGLPLDGRNFYELSLLLPGVLPPSQGSAGTARGDFAIHVNGAREDANGFLLDGVYNGDPKLNGVSATPPVDAIREFEVLTSTYDASFGRNAGGQVNVVMLSGTNQLHGTVYEFFRNAALDARNRFAPAGEPAPKNQRNQFGFSLGGPILRNRAFFFGDYEGRRIREGITRVTNVPTALERAGDFSQSPVPPIDLFTGAPFPGNRIPAARLHPIGLGIASLYPLPNRSTPGENFVSSPVRDDRSDSFDVRTDFKLASSDDFGIRYSLNDRDLYEPFSGAGFALIPGYGTGIPRRAQNAMAQETHVFRPNLLNELRAGFNRVAGGAFQEMRGSGTNAQLGLPELFTNARDRGLSLITLPGYSPVGDEYNNPQNSVTNVYQIVDQATLTTGSHLFKFGGDIRALQQNAFRDVQSRGLLSFIGLSGNPLGDLLQGFPTVTAVARLDNHQNLRSKSFSLFAHDTVRLPHRMVLSAGLRYEYNSPPVDVRDRARIYNPAAGGLADVGQGGVPRGGFLPDRNNLAPRIGLAWSLTDNLVIRTAYSLNYDQSALAPGEGLYFSPPYFDLRLFVTAAQYPLLLHNPFPRDYPFPSPPSALAFQRDLRTPYIQQWNFNVQRAIGRSRVFEAAYVGSKGTKLLAARDLNQPAPSVAPLNLRPNPLFQDVTVLESRANSSYHSLQARFQQRFTAGLGGLVSYTYGKSIDDASNFFTSAGDPNFPQDSNNLTAERGRSSFDVRHRLALSYSYELPLGRKSVWGGWQTHGIWTFQTGRPFTVALLPDLDNSNTGRSNLGFGANDRPNRIRDGGLDNPSAARWFDTSAFSLPRYGTFGNSGRNILDGPGSAAINASVIKNTHFSERTLLQFRAEAFNLLNRTNYDQPDNFFGSPTFGRILSAQAPRRLQLGLKLLF